MRSTKNKHHENKNENKIMLPPKLLKYKFKMTKTQRNIKDKRRDSQRKKENRAQNNKTEKSIASTEVRTRDLTLTKRAL